MSHDAKSPVHSDALTPSQGELRAEVASELAGPDLVAEELLSALREDGFGPGGAAEQLATMREGLQGRLQQERGLLATVRSLPTSARYGAAFGILGMVLLWAGLAAAPGAPTGQVLVKLAALAVLAGVLMAVALRPLHRRALPEGVRISILLAAFVVPAGLAFWGGSGGHSAFASEMLGSIPCFVKGSVFALPLVFIVAALNRGGRPSMSVFLATAAGVGGNILLESRCNGGAPGHIMFGHVGGDRRLRACGTGDGSATPYVLAPRRLSAPPANSVVKRPF